MNQLQNQEESLGELERLQSLSILYFEDRPEEAELVMLHIQKHYQECSVNHVSTKNEYIKALVSGGMDIILSDYNIPGIRNKEALELAKSHAHGVPFIYVTGALGERVAVSVLKSGATDYILKDNLEKLNHSINRAITEYKARQEKEIARREKNELMDELMRSEMRYRGLFETVGVGIAVVDRVTEVIVDSNVKLESLTGFSKDELSSKSLRSMLTKIDISASNAQTVESPRNLTTSKERIHELKIKRKDGTNRYVEINIVAEGESEDSQNVIIAFHDITDRIEAARQVNDWNKSLEQEVRNRTIELEESRSQLEKSLLKERELGELKSRFVATASHQFRTPLTVIKSNIDLLSIRSDQMDSEFRTHFDKAYRRINSQIQKMNDLMNDVLVLGKIDAGRIDKKREDVDLISILEDNILRYIQTDDEGRRVSLKVEGTPRPILSDQDLLDHAFSNILSNALKYSPNRPAPIIQVTYTDESITVEVEDFGIGIPEDELKNVMTPFYRASNTEAVKGTGLGMAIVKEYIELCGGTIKVDSVVNQGTIVTVNLNP